MQNNENLHKQFVRLGNDRRKLTNELLALLPEINERGTYKKYAGSIVEYAGKFGGLSKGVVLKRLRLEKYLAGKPKLKEAIKTEGIHKIGMMASLVTTENEDFIVDKVKNMSKSAVQELSKEMRANNEGEKTDQNLFGETVQTVSCKAVPQRISIELDEEMSFLFLKLKNKIGMNLSNREVMKKILETMDSQFDKKQNKKTENDKNQTSTDKKVIPGDSFLPQDKPDSHKKKYKIDINDYILQPPATRYIPSKIKKQIISKTNGQCSYPNCNRPAEILHHVERFAANHSHHSLKPLCKEHHEFAHNGLIKNEKDEVARWSLDLDNTQISKVDTAYRKYRLQ